MYICPKCKIEMRCEKNGVTASWHQGHHCIPGDKYKCRNCDNEVLVAEGMVHSLSDYEIAQRRRDGTIVEMVK